MHDTDVAGYLKHAHEQTLISTIEEGRRETQEEFYRVLEERGRRDWEARKKRVFEELGGRVAADGKTNGDLRKSVRAAAALGVSYIVNVERLVIENFFVSNHQVFLCPTICKCRVKCLLTIKL